MIQSYQPKLSNKQSKILVILYNESAKYGWDKFFGLPDSVFVDKTLKSLVKLGLIRCYNGEYSIIQVTDYGQLVAQSVKLWG